MFQFLDSPLATLHISHLVIICVLGFGVSRCLSVTDPNDLAVLREFQKGLKNSELLSWLDDDDPCGSKWPHVYCSGDRVSQIQIQNLGLQGPLPSGFNGLSKLSKLDFQGNQFTGSLPSFSGLSDLVYADMNDNEFDSIPLDFFNDLTSLQVLALDNNPLNASTGWTFPSELKNSNQMVRLSMIKSNLVGELPDFVGGLPFLIELKLSYNRLAGGLPLSFQKSRVQILWLKDSGLKGSITVISLMTSLRELNLQGNKFTGTIPDISNLTSLRYLDLSSNQFVGEIPQSLAAANLTKLNISINHLMGSIPHFKVRKVTYYNNNFCQSVPEVPCSADVSALLGFLTNLNYPISLVLQWSGNDPCAGHWDGITCDDNSKITRLILPNHGLTGTLSPSVSVLVTLFEIKLGKNNLTGRVPESWTGLKALRLLDLSDNNFEPPLPKFRSEIKVVLKGNPMFDDKKSLVERQNLIIIGAVAGTSLICIVLAVYACRKKTSNNELPPRDVVTPNDPSDQQIVAGSSTENRNSSSSLTPAVVDSGNVIPLQILQRATNNFSSENEVGRGGFGFVYKGILDNGTQIAVKRMESRALSDKVLKEFQTEIQVLSKVRHRHLVSLLGYSIEGNERLLVYEFMPQGALSRHLFHWERLKLEPLSLATRLGVALDVARGLDYLHGLTQGTFIHRDLKSSNILLGEDFRAKISDFGLVKTVPGVGQSISNATRVVGTFGYLAPEYAVMGRITTKSDVYSYGVVLMELLTGLKALDENRAEETHHLPQWFADIKSDNEKLKEIIDKTLGVETDQSIAQSIFDVAKLARLCTAKDPSHRPDVSYVVSVLTPLVEKWQPIQPESEDSYEIDYELDLGNMSKDNNTIDIDSHSP